MTSDQARVKYGPGILRILSRTIELLGRNGIQVRYGAAEDLPDDEYHWAATVADGNTVLGLDFYITEQAAREGDGEGLSFLYDAVEEGGIVRGSVTVGNYSPECWLTDEEDLDERFAIFEDQAAEQLAAQILASRTKRSA